MSDQADAAPPTERECPLTAGRILALKQLTEDAEHRLSQTTAEEDRHAASQRKVNLIWEYTQSYIAVMVVTASLAGAFFFGTSGIPPLLANAFFLIVGFYFGRTNHQLVGGIQIGR